MSSNTQTLGTVTPAKTDSAATSPLSAPVLHRMQSGIQIWSEAQKSSSFGRAPWYGGTRKRRSKQTFLIGVAGGTASGKTSVCKAVISQLNIPWVQILSLDCFYKVLTPKQIELANKELYNFDHPDAFDWKLLERILNDIKQGLAVNVPIYDFSTHSRQKETTLMYGADVVLCEGILTLYNTPIRDMFDVKVFVNTDDDIRLIRRIRRDRKERGRSIESILDQYEKTVKPSYESFCVPTQRFADVIIPRGKDNVVAIGLLVDHIRHKLTDRGVIRANLHSTGLINESNLPVNVHQLDRFYKETHGDKAMVILCDINNNNNNSGSDFEVSDSSDKSGQNSSQETSPRGNKKHRRRNNNNNTASGTSSGKRSPKKEDLISLKDLFDKLYDEEYKGLPLLRAVDTLARELLRMVRFKLKMSQKRDSLVKKQLSFDKDGNLITNGDKNKEKKKRVNICAASIIRGGLIFENGLKLAFPDSHESQTTTVMKGTQGSLEVRATVSFPNSESGNNNKSNSNTTTLDVINDEIDSKVDNNNNNDGNNNDINNSIDTITESDYDSNNDESIQWMKTITKPNMANIGRNYTLMHGNLHISHEQNNPELPRFFKCQLPENLNECEHVMLFDALMGTGNRARMAIQVLLDHHVPEENIYFVSLVSSRAAVATLARFFPNTHFVTGMIDEKLESSHWSRIDGISSVVIRYFDAVGIKMGSKPEVPIDI